MRKDSILFSNHNWSPLHVYWVREGNDGPVKAACDECSFNLYNSPSEKVKPFDFWEDADAFTDWEEIEGGRYRNCDICGQLTWGHSENIDR